VADVSKRKRRLPTSAETERAAKLTGLGQRVEQVAVDLGVTRRMIERWLRGTSNAERKFATAIARARAEMEMDLVGNVRREAIENGAWQGAAWLLRNDPAWAAPSERRAAKKQQRRTDERSRSRSVPARPRYPRAARSLRSV
jgi:transcriptional regulator with XRE-family HTH domain